jgi:hypothetical protein
MTPDGSEFADTWHQTLALAKTQAEYELGIPESAWRPGK